MQDYSGFTRAAEIQAQGMQNLGASIGGAIESYADAKEKRKKIEASTKASRAGIESAIKLGDAYGIDIKSSLEPILAKMDDPNTTPMEAAMYGEEAKNRITNVLNMGITASEREGAQQRAMMEQQYKGAQLALESEKVDIARQKASQGPTPKFELRKPQITSPTGEIFEGPELPYDVNRGMYFDTKANKYIADPNLIGTGKEYAPDSAMPTPTSQVGSGAADLIASAAQMNIGKLSTAKTPGTQGGNVGCADAICRTFKQATGEELVPGGTLSTREMATTLESDPRFVKIPITEAQKGDIVLTPRKGNKAGHTGIVLDGGAIASNSSKGFAGKAPGTFVQNYTIDSWKKNVAPRNPSETAAYRYVKTQGIDNALAMGGDMTQQAMGTPEQQAMLSQQIEQGAGMATAQNVPQGAVATEPSMATQQPQLPQQTAPQWSPPSGFVPKQGKFRKASPEEEAYYGTRGQVNLETGEFVAKGGQIPSTKRTPQEDLESQRLTTLDKEQADLRSAGLSESQNIAQLKGIKDLLDSNVKTGFGRETIMKARRVLGKDVANEEQFGSLVGNEAMKNIALTKGAISDREMEYFKTVLSPNMGKTTEGNKRIIDFKIKYAERASKIAKTISKMQSQKADPYQIQEQIDNIIASEPLFSPSDSNITPQNQTQSDVDFLNAYPSTKGYPSGE